MPLFQQEFVRKAVQELLKSPTALAWAIVGAVTGDTIHFFTPESSLPMSREQLASMLGLLFAALY